MPIPGGYILLARKITESGIMDKPPLYFKLWVWMLEQANHKDGYKGLKRGQFFTTIEDMREAMSWHVGYRKVKPTRKEIRNPYEWFMKGHMIDIEKVTHGMVITILNYDEYQNPRNYEGHTEGPHEKDTKGQRGAQYKQEGEERKNVNNKSPDGDSSPNSDSGTASPPPECPHQKIIEIYHEELPELPAVQVWGDASRGNLRARWREDPKRQSPEWWRRFFREYVRTSDFLMGRVKDWQASLDWIVRPKNFQKIMNGLYVNKNNGGLNQRTRNNLQACEEFINGADD